MCNYTHYTVWDEIIYPAPNFNTDTIYFKWTLGYKIKWHWNHDLNKLRMTMSPVQIPPVSFRNNARLPREVMFSKPNV